MSGRPEISRPPEVVDARDAVGALATAPITARGLLANASNATLLVRLGEPAAGAGTDPDDPVDGDPLDDDPLDPEAAVHAVYKPRVGERPLWDFPEGTLHLREVAAFEVSRFLGWDLVPPTVLRDGPYGPGSVQLFVRHDPQRHYFVLVEEARWHDDLARIAYFDLLLNNADRKGSHILHDEAAGRLVGIDHGLTFHEAPKLRTVVWDLDSPQVADSWRADVGRLHDALAAHDPVLDGLAELLSPTELTALRQRAASLRELRLLPLPPSDRRPYPWPPL